MLKPPDIFIGIDPDVDKSGFAKLDRKTMGIAFDTLTFPELIKTLRKAKDKATADRRTLRVVVEASWLISHNWHIGNGQVRGAGAIAKTGYNVGRNHQIGLMIVQYCKAMGIDVIEQRPLKKCWKGPDGKITHAELAYFVPGLPSRTNSEERDALLLMWNEANLPMKIKI
jgi:hypothetical protein